MDLIEKYAKRSENNEPCVLSVNFSTKSTICHFPLFFGRMDETKKNALLSPEQLTKSNK